MNRCTFCQIIAGEKTSQTVYKDDIVTAFHDIHPVAPTHILIVPNKHLSSINDLTYENEALIGRLFMVASQLAKGEGIEKSGYRLTINTGPHANQTINHLHLHLIGGQPMYYPMG